MTMAGELGYDPTSGQLVYSPATGQLALDCLTAVTCPTDCSGCAASFDFYISYPLAGLTRSGTVTRVGSTCVWETADQNQTVYCQNDGEWVDDGVGGFTWIDGPLWVFEDKDSFGAKVFAPVSPDNLVCPPAGAWATEWPYSLVGIGGLDAFTLS